MSADRRSACRLSRRPPRPPPPDARHPDALRAQARAARRRRRDAAARSPLARAIAFVALAAWGALHWMSLLEPAEPDRALAGARGRAASRSPRCSAPGSSPAAGATSPRSRALRPADRADAAGRARARRAAAARRLERAGRRHLARDLRPARRARALPRPRRLGAHGDPARRHARSCCSPRVLAFWPRRSRLGFPGAALLVLVVLYVVPVIALGFARRVPQRRGLHAADGRVPAPGEAAPARRAGAPPRSPWPRRSSRSSPRRCSTATRRGSTTRRGRWRRRSSKSTSFTWDHNYGGLNWPRDGRELLRVTAHDSPRTGRPRTSTSSTGACGVARAGPARGRRAAPTTRAPSSRWTQHIKVSIRNLRSDQFITAGYASDVDIPRLERSSRRSDGLYVPPRTLRRGDAYTATVYTPQPDASASAARAGADYDFDLASYTTIEHRPCSASRRAGHVRMTFPFFGDRRRRDHLRARRATGRRTPCCARAGLIRTYELARRLAEGARTPDEYVQRRARPPRPPTSSPTARCRRRSRLDARRLPLRRQAGLLPAVLGRDGAAAADGGHPGARRHRLLAPARPTPRPASTSCATSTRTRGSRSTTPAGAGCTLTRRRPTRPPAASPRTPRPSTSNANPTGSTQPFGGDPLSDRGAGTAAVAEPAPWWRIPAILGGALALVRPRVLPRAAPLAARCPAGAVGARARTPPHAPRARARDDAARARVALRQHPPAAAGYVRALRESRYRDEPSHPTRAQRRGLRSELGRGGGILGRLRAWWALPPR